MEARAQTVRDILHAAAQYAVPLFQRSYSWHKEHWRRLNGDIMALVEEPEREVHFLGPLVSTLSKTGPGELPVYQLIDGQQRLTTLTVFLAALRDVACERELSDLAEEITEDYLIHKRKKDLERFKVLPRVGDREALKAIIDGDDLTPYAKLRLVHAWRFFRRQIQHRVRLNQDAELRNLFVTVSSRLSLVVITIDGENPYEIFESLNATGLPLAESDLIRNFVFMQVPMHEQEAFDQKYWRPLEHHFEAWGDDRSSVMTGFFREYLMRKGNYCRENNTFVDFKQKHRERGLNAEKQTKELLRFAPLAVQIRNPATCPSIRIRQQLANIAQMDMGTANALLLNLLDRNVDGKFDEDALCQCMNDLVSFVLRRTICGDTTRQYGRWFVEAIDVLGREPVRNLRKYLLQRGWPDDASFSRALEEFQLYKRESQKTQMILEALERNSKHKERVEFKSLSIEHIMPQSIGNDVSGKSWKKVLGNEWEDLHEAYLHVLGNLTLTGYNPKLGKMAYKDKQVVYFDSNIMLNRYFRKITCWDAQAILRRTKHLANILCEIWPRPDSSIPYDSDIEIQSMPKASSSVKQRYLDYWRMFLKQWKPDSTVLLPEPIPSPDLVIPLDEAKGVFIHLRQFRKGKRLVAYVRFRRRIGRRIFASLYERAKEIDDQITGSLEWDWPCRNSFSVFEENVDFADRDDWEIQHAWLHEEVSDIIETLKPELGKVIAEKNDVVGGGKQERQRLKLAFWSDLLSYAAKKTDLHSNRTPGKYNWINGGIGRSGFSINYVIRNYESQVEIYIDTHDKPSTKMAFHALKKDQDEIEAIFGDILDWMEQPKNRSSRIRKILPGGWRSPPETWKEIHVSMVEAMIRLDKAFRPRIKKLRM